MLASVTVIMHSRMAVDLLQTGARDGESSSHIIVIQPANQLISNMACNGNSSESKSKKLWNSRNANVNFLACGGSNRLNVYQYYSGSTTSTSSLSASSTLSSPSTMTSSDATGLPSGWKYGGCYIDNAKGRIMLNQQNDNNQLTVESCVQTCSGIGYKIAGMEYAQQWFVFPWSIVKQ
jgi:hypothetical protein